jgi:hypothetical protein
MQIHEFSSALGELQHWPRKAISDVFLPQGSGSQHPPDRALDRVKAISLEFAEASEFAVRRAIVPGLTRHTPQNIRYR